MIRRKLHERMYMDLLGPGRGGTSEELEIVPIDEYSLGILGFDETKTADDEEFFDEKYEKNGILPSNQDVDDENLSVNKKLGKPRIFGLSLLLNEKTKMDVLVTWATYNKLDSKWKRIGHWASFSKSSDEPGEELIECKEDNCKNKIKFHLTNNKRNLQGKCEQISVYMENEEGRSEEYAEGFIFQPQIRIILHEPKNLKGWTRNEKAELDILFRNKQVYARGKNCSAVWREIDNSKYFMNDGVPFNWPDAKNIPQDKRKKFIEPDIRTEFLPYYQITQPHFVPKDLDEEVFDSAKMSQWKTENLVELQDFIASYEKWVNGFDRDAIEENYQNEFDKNLSSCRDLLHRMKEGIQELSLDKDALLAFNIMNEAINRQSKWTRKTSESFRWRAFQVAFVLASIKGILKNDKSEREICDLLWFPTGSGKTEAYLGLAALLIAYKRITVDKESNSAKHVGTVVLSRYTLRFLTIQQFRRSSAVFTALECIRTEGWVPNWYKEEIKFYEKRFSIGLWVGDSVTPNNIKKAIGALEKSKKTGSEPAQVIDCPVCGHVISCTDTSFMKDKPREIHWVVSSENDLRIDPFFVNWKKKFREFRYQIEKSPTVIKKGNSYIISIIIEPLGEIDQGLIDDLWKDIESAVNGISTEFVRASRPGYFLYSKDKKSSTNNDFSIHCTNPGCSLNNSDVGWSDLTPSGAAQFPTIFKDVGKDNKSWSIPIPSYTVDDQIYDNCPNMVISTVDKIARLTWNPRGASIFGNVDVYCDRERKFSRVIDKEDSYQPKKAGKFLHFGCRKDKLVEVEPPSLILQDELHLIDGPLGSMTGLYESVIELLCTSEENRKPKYIASSATVNAASKQIKSLFSKKARVFPPNMEDIDDNYFSWKENNYEIKDQEKGRLYVGLDTSSAKSPTTLTVNSWASILQGVGDARNDLLKKGKPTDDELRDLDSFWTLVGYFNAKKELSNTRGIYRDDIPERMTDRDLDESNVERLWGETKAFDLPGILDRIKTPSGSIDSMNTLDVIFCTSMFGTGIDIDRLASMYIVGQPKTTSNYIQASGRIGRQTGGLAVVQLKASAPRDKNQYEFFNGFHHALHYFVEPVTVYPFAIGALDIALGPVIVMLLRNAKQINGTDINKKWIMNPNCIVDSSNATLIDEIKKYFVERAMNQPDGRKIDRKSYEDYLDWTIGKWITVKKELDRERRRLYYDDWSVKGKMPKDVVLGDSQAKKHGSVRVVYDLAPHSLRNTEDTMALGVGDKFENPLVRPSQFTYTFGAGAIYETNLGTKIIPEISEWVSRNFDIGNWANSNHEIMNSHFSISQDLKDSKVFVLPTNVDISNTTRGQPLDERDSILDLWPFPRWRRCIGDKGHRGRSYIFQGSTCPECGNDDIRTSVRFVRVCQRGHMDDVDWKWEIHGKNQCSSEYLEWKERSKSITGIDIECPKCKGTKNMSEIYNKEGPCNGFWAESRKRDSSCEVSNGMQEKMYVTIKTSPSNRYPVISSFLAISPTDRSKERRLAMKVKAELMNMINLPGNPYKKSKLGKVMFDSFGEMKKKYGKLTTDRQQVYGAMRLDKKNKPSEWESKWDENFSLVCDFEESRMSVGYEDNYAVLVNEFKNLTNASARQLSSEYDVFDVDYSGIFSTNLNKKIKLNVTPVTRITVDSVQIGYKRTPKGPIYSCKVNNNVIPGHEDHQELDVQIAGPKPFRRGDDKWYPGIREKGEGIFISSADLNTDSILAMSEDDEFRQSVLDWQGQNKDAFDRWEEPKDRMSYIMNNPVYVWWHSFAHRMIDSLAMDSGYSSSAIRERIYFDEKENGKSFGGCLLFAHTSGADGTLGGLVSLANTIDFKNVLLNAKEKVLECSNGPLCSNDLSHPSPSSCYACMYMSETTCTWNNTNLDRRILRNW